MGANLSTSGSVVRKASFLAALALLVLWIGLRFGEPLDPAAAQVVESDRSTAQTPVEEASTLEPPRSRRASLDPAAEVPQGGVALRVVLDRDYEPLSQFVVELAEPGPELDEPVRRQKTYAQVTWEDLEPGNYRLRASADGWKQAGRDIELAAGAAEVRVHVRMHPFNSFAGYVHDRYDGRAVTEYGLQAEFRSEQGAATVWPARNLKIRAEDGRFAVAAAPSAAELIRLTVSADGYLATTTDWLAAQAHFENLDVALGRAGLEESMLSARAVHSNGMPAPGTKMMLVDPGATMDLVRLSGGDAQVSAAADVTGDVALGRARTETDDDGRGRIVTRYEGSARLLVVPRDGKAFLTEPFELMHGGEIDLGDLRIEAGGVIAGQVWVGDTPPDVVVRSVTAERESGATVSARIESDGSFRIEGLEAGSYRVSTVGELSGPEGATIAIIPLATVRLWIDEGDTHHVELHCGSGTGGSTVFGRVELLEELDELRVVVLDVDLNPVSTGFAAEDGSFRLTDVPDGDYTLAVMGRSEAMDCFAATFLAVSLPSAASALLDVWFRHSRVELRAPSTPGEPFRAIASTGNALFDELVGVALEGVLDADGFAVVWGLPAGSYRFHTSRAEQAIAIPAEGGVFAIGL